MTFNFRLLPGETDPKIFQCKKHHFWPILLIFGQKQNSKFCFYDCLFLILSVIVPSLKKLIGGFQATLGSDGRTDKHKLIEPFRFMPRVQK